MKKQFSQGYMSIQQVFQNTLLCVIMMLTAATCFGQKQFFVHDSRTNAPIPFVKVYPTKGTPFLTDIDGMFEIEETVSRVTLRYSGYIDTLVKLDEVKDNTILFKKDIQEVQEVTVTPGVNPAHRIIREAQKNRKKNHPLKNDAFVYKSYSKFVFDVNQDIMIPEDAEDTLTFKLQKYFTNQHLFVLESASKRTFEPPGKDQEEIIAFKLSGISDPSLSTFAQSMQSFNFYDNQFKIMGESFMNPIANDGINRYLFILEDTLARQADTTYTIYFRPKKGKNFKGLEGRLYINTNGFAVEKVKATTSRPSGTGPFDVTVVQEYDFIDNTKWFPVKLSTDLAFGEFVDGKDTINGMVYGSGHSYIDSIVINPEVKRKGIYDNYDLYTSPDVTELEEDEWKTMRKYELSEKERRTHYKVDSLAKANRVGDRLAFFKELAKGNIQLGYVSIPLKHLMRYNQYEGYRAGAGIETSPKLSKVFKIGGYAGWGTRDKDWKYGGYSSIRLNQKRNTFLKLKFQQDVIERGGQSFQSSGFDLNNTDLLRGYFIEQMERQRLAEVSFSSDLKANMNVRVFGNYQRIEYTQDYQFTPSNASTYAHPEKVDVAEIGVEAKWNIGERYMRIGDTKVSQGLKYPSIRVMAVKGISELWESKYDYWRFNAEITQKLNVRDYFSLNLKLAYNKTTGDVPLYLMQNGKGTRINWMVDVENTFQTMTAGSNYSREQIAFFTRLKFKPFHTKAAWNEPRIGLHHALGFGSFNNRDDHQLEFETMEKGYFETGLILDNLIIMNKVSGFGIGAFYNYGPNSDADWEQNIVPKITLNFSL